MRGMSDRNMNVGNNLARIRDNQRRSRARRKEYLQELEGKLRTCEQLGIEASAGMQAAARRVLEENKRLRALLRQKGVREEEMDRYTGHQQVSVQHPSAGSSLEMMLETRRPCYGNRPRQSGSMRPTRTATPMLQSLDLSVQRSGSPQAVLDAEFSSSCSALSNQMHAPNTVPIRPVNLATTQVIPAVTGTLRDSQVFLQTQRELQSQTTYTAPVEETWAPSTTPVELSPNDNSTNTSSCCYAARIIRTMKCNVGTELEADLGCSNVDADCKVRNSVVFDVMEKYST